MKILFPVTLLLFISSQLLAQFSLDKFWSIELGSSLSTVKQLFPNEKWAERETGNGNIHSYFSWFEPNSIKVSFLVTKADRLRMKSISNGKVDEESAKKLYDHLKEILLKKFGDKYEKKDLMGKSFLLWRIGEDGMITLSNDGAKTIMVNLEAVGIPF
ncbi:MAG: hypothetical protein HY963_02230 [Ignavibacteriales bacterium]|nr:hypothetical protein [Ignavibacteriales bacterium]